MRCQYAAATDQFHGWECQITGGECVLLIPNEKSCPALIDVMRHRILPGDECLQSVAARMQKEGPERFTPPRPFEDGG